MRTTVRPALAMLILAATAACSDTAPEPTSPDTESLIASATEWTPADITRDLQVDDATRQAIETGLSELHKSLLGLHARYETAESLAGDARAAVMNELDEAVRSIHEQHSVLWNSLDPDVRETLAERLHERMREHDDGTMTSLHERMRRLHGDGAGH